MSRLLWLKAFSFGVLLAVLAGVPSVAADTGRLKGTLVAELASEQATEFSAYVRMRGARQEEIRVIARMLKEKRGELSDLIGKMAADFGIAPDCSYMYKAATKSLYLLSSNKVDKASVPERTLLRTFTSAEEAKEAEGLILARRLTEQQIRVLEQLRVEKQCEFRNTDSQLRKRFKLDSGTAYHLDEATGRLMCVTPPQTDGGDADNLDAD